MKTNKFLTVDASWKSIMKDTNSNPLCMRAYPINPAKENYLETFRTNNKILDEIQKALDQFLEKKRQQFSRFFFLSNDELLLILAEANRNPYAVQPHLRKLFENVNKIVLGESTMSENIVKIESAENEVIKLTKFPKTREQVERWLKDLEEYLVTALKKIIKKAYDDKNEDEENKHRADWIMNNVSQAVTVASSIQW
jgi:dynein heavy chain